MVRRKTKTPVALASRGMRQKQVWLDEMRAMQSAGQSRFFGKANFSWFIMKILISRLFELLCLPLHCIERVHSAFNCEILTVSHYIKNIYKKFGHKHPKIFLHPLEIKRRLENHLCNYSFVHQDQSPIGVCGLSWAKTAAASKWPLQATWALLFCCTWPAAADWTTS